MNDFLPSELCYLFYWINERESVRRLKQSGAPKPWTAEPLLQRYRWCNVSRMDDSVSVELFQHWYGDNDPKTVVVAASLARLVNWPTSLLATTDEQPFALRHLPAVRPMLHRLADAGIKVFTGAYLIPGVPSCNKIDSIMDLIEHIATTDPIKNTLRATWESFIEFDGVGSFLAGQICADLAQLPIGEKWPDRFTWAPVGPGSARGMNRLRGRPKEQAISQKQFDTELQEYIVMVRPIIADIDTDRRLCAQDYQGTLCEFDKFRRLQLNEGTVRARYNGEK